MTIHMNTSQGRAWGRLAEIAAGSVDSNQLRESMGVPLLDLLGADTYASMVWNANAQRFGGMVSVDMDPVRLKQWQHYYRHVDPLTMPFMQRRKPTVATQIIARPELVRSEFFGDFLRPQQMHWGINVFFFDGGECLGDLRIWRSYRRGNFDDGDIDMLRLAEPIVLAALVRMHRGAGSQTLALPESKPALSPRELQVARLLRAGASDNDIARTIGISYATVRFHVGRLMRKLDVSNRTAAVACLCAGSDLPELEP